MHISYNNKYFSILGDSLSTFEGFSVPREAVFYDTQHKLESNVLCVNDTWWGRVIERFGGRLLVNNSISGSTVSWLPAYEIPSHGCSVERTSSLCKDGISPDVIMVLIGTNDWGCGRTIAYTDGCKFDSESLSLFSVAYNTMLSRLRGQYPCAEIWCFTLPVSRCSRADDFIFPYSISGHHISDYCESVRECAARHGCLLIDLYKHSEPYDTIDGFHPNSDGMKTIANVVLKIVMQG